MTLVALIPARIGSKGIPRKNLRKFKGKPLIAWTISQAINSKYIERTIVSTDDEEIADEARRLGAEVPFLRPKELANDNSLVFNTVLHTLENIPEITDILLMQPTSPLRRLKDIETIINLRKEYGSHSAVSLVEVSEYPQWMFKINGHKLKNVFGDQGKTNNRQNLGKYYVLNGSLYLSSKIHLIEKGSFISDETLPYIMPKEFSIDIDEEKDWQYAEFLYDRIKHNLER
tara:strand:- start:79 stop:768 length:690 start_codon:yes stop_codon:yes gene_type:complete